ncbi:MAG: hypothetical protein KDI63_09270 [Gammaproteobacteria bacterium]|nr:hypothetical protein [Gammaproteobacteria bacterium]
MGLKKLIGNLRDYLDEGEREAFARCDRIDTLLNKLAEKQEKLEKKLENESNASKRKKLKMDLKVIAVQRKKGIVRRQELEDKCK